MAASITFSKRILANLFLLLANQKECAEWWFGFNTNDKDINDINKIEPTRYHNKYSLNELLGISYSDWNMFLLDSQIIVKRGKQIKFSIDNLERFKCDFNLQFVSTFHSKR